MINLSLSLTKSMSYSFIWMLFVIPSCVFSAAELHKFCSAPFSCGDQKELFYPFWTSGREDCGHPDFEVNCSRGYAELSISSEKFRILSANYDSGIIRLTRSGYINDPCLQDSINMSFEEKVLPLAPTSELLTIYYDCNPDFPKFDSPYIKDLDCRNDLLQGYYDRRDYYVTRSLSSPLLQGYSALLNDFTRLCRRNVSTPVSKIGLNILESNASTDNLKKALNEGFALGINLDCKMCTDSGGACGYNQTHTTTTGFVCYCIDEAPNRTCKPTNKGPSNAAKAGVGAASVLVGFLFIAGALILLIRRRRKGQSGQYERQQNLKALISLKHYRYTQVKRITNSFAEVIGKGGFGTVYKGTLCDGRSVVLSHYKFILGRSQGLRKQFRIWTAVNKGLET